MHHQMWMRYQLLMQPEQSTSNLLYGGDDINPGKQFTNKSAMYIFVYKLISCCTDPDHVLYTSCGYIAMKPTYIINEHCMYFLRNRYNPFQRQPPS